MLALEPAQRPQLTTRQGVNGWRAALRAVDVKPAVGEVDGVPAQRHQLCRPQPVPVGDQHHGSVAVAMAVEGGRRDHAGHLGVGEVLAYPNLGVLASPRRGLLDHCPIYGGWRYQR